MATWRCPHCGTLQADAALCFLCQRSATSCGTCANFRRSVVSGVGYCGLDRDREPLTGEERRPCWTSSAPASLGGLFEELDAPAAEVPARPLADELPRAGRRGRLIELHPSAPGGS